MIFLGINVLTEKINPNDIDLTKEQLYSLTEESKEKIAALPETDKFQVYLFDYDEANAIVDMADQYAKVNPNITVEVINSTERADLVSKYEAQSGMVVIVAGEKNKTFSYYDFYSYDYNSGKELNVIEERLTNGLIALSSKGKITPVYVLTGHNERSITQDLSILKMYLELENYELKELDLLTAQNVPEDCKNLIIASPEKDFTDYEANAIKAYIERGGNILWLSNPLSIEGEAPCIKSILDLFGVTIRQDGLVMEQDTSRMVMGRPDVILTTVEPSSLTQNIGQVLLFDSGKIDFVGDEELEKLSVKKTNLLTSSEKSFFRTNLALGANSSPSETNGEKEESSVLGALLEKSVQNGEKTANLAIFANSIFLEDEPVMTGTATYAAVGFYNNRDLAINTIAYLSEVEEGMTIRKEIEMTSYTATETQDRIVKIIIFTVPVLIIVIGIVVWQLRRRKK